MTMSRFQRLLCPLFILISATVVAQSRSAAFDVVSVKRYLPDGGGLPGDAITVLPGGRFTAPSATLRSLVAAAYGLLDIQIVDSARVLGDARFEIEGRTRADVTVDEARAMLRALLADRFGLTAHRETRELPVHVLTLARDDRTLGASLRASGPECAPPKGPASAGVPAPPPPPPPPAGLSFGTVIDLNGTPARCPSIVFGSASGAHWSFRETTIPLLAQRLIEPLGRPVLDRTGLTGPFDVDLTYTQDNPTVDAPDAPNAPSLRTALREQLGLRIDSTRAPVEVLVIDRVRQPSEN